MIQVNTASFRLTAVGLNQAIRDAPYIRSRVVEEAGRRYFAECQAHISLRDHSLSDLAALDHPYARRHGFIQGWKLKHKKKLAGFFGDSMVHTEPMGRKGRKQTGRLRRSLKQHPVDGGWRVLFDVGAAPHAEAVVSGTKLMLPRDVLWLTGLDRGTQRKMMIAVVRVLGKEFRTKSAIRFQRVPNPYA